MMKTAYFWVIGVALMVVGCSVSYSFTGISTDAKTVSIRVFPNQAPLSPPTYSQEFTEALRDIFITQTNIELVDRRGELQFEGEIVGYVNQPMAIQGNDQAALNRLSITVNVRFVNTLDETQNFEQRFTRFEDYDATQNLTAVEQELTSVINEQLTQDILTRAIGNW